MKKILSFLVMSLVAILPFEVSAASKITYDCSDFDAEGIRNCTVGYVIDQSTPQDSVSVKLTEHGGAEITTINGVSDSEFSISTQNETDGVYSVVLIAVNGKQSGEHSLLTFRYKKSGTEDCKVTVGIGNDNKDLPEETTPDEPTENVKTGSTLPYIALGTITLIAIGAYLTTKNKSKMYKI